MISLRQLRPQSSFLHKQNHEGFQVYEYPPVASGGTTTYTVVESGQTYMVHRYNYATSGSSALNQYFDCSKRSLIIDYLVIGGGGAGGIWSFSGTCSTASYNVSGGGGGVGYATGTTIDRRSDHLISVGAGRLHGCGSSGTSIFPSITGDSSFTFRSNGTTRTITAAAGVNSGTTARGSSGNIDRYNASGTSTSTNSRAYPATFQLSTPVFFLSTGNTFARSGLEIGANPCSSSNAQHNPPAPGDGGSGSSTFCSSSMFGRGQNGAVFIRYKTWQYYSESIDALQLYRKIIDFVGPFWGDPKTIIDSIDSTISTAALAEIDSYIDKNGNFLSAFDTSPSDTKYTDIFNLTSRLVRFIARTLIQNYQSAYNNIKDISGFMMTNQDAIAATTANIPAITNINQIMPIIQQYIQMYPAWIMAAGSNHSLSWSNDGYMWKGLGTTIFSRANVVKWNGSIWVAGGTGSNTFSWSDDGINWTGVSGFLKECKDLAWNGSSWVAVGDQINTGRDCIITSPDGKNWTTRTSISSSTIASIVWNSAKARWIAAAESGYYYSNSAVTNWQSMTMSQTNKFVYIISLEADGFLGIRSNATLGSSSDGVSWTDYSSNLNTLLSSGNYIASNGSRMIATGTPLATNTIPFVYSDNSGATWFAATIANYTNQIRKCNSLHWNGFMWMAACDGSIRNLYSYDGISWTLGSNFQITMELNYNWSTITISNPVNGFGWTPPRHYTYLVESFKRVILQLIAQYENTIINLQSSGISIPNYLNFKIVRTKLYLSIHERPLLTTIKSSRSGIPELTGNTTTVNSQTYTVTYSTSQFPDSTYDGFNDTGSGWIKNATDRNPYIQIQMTSRLAVGGFILINNSVSVFSYSSYEFMGSNDGSTWTTLYSIRDLAYTRIGETYVTLQNTISYSYYRFSATKVMSSSLTDSTGNSGISSKIILLANSDIAPTKQEQLLQIHQLYKNANDSLQAILQSTKFKTTYEAARRYLMDSELSTTTLTTRDKIYNATAPYNLSEIREGRRDILKTLITKYYTLNPTGAAMGPSVSNITVPSGPSTANLPPSAAVGDDVTAADDAGLDAAETRFLTGGTALWPLLMTSIDNFVANYINSTYKGVRDAAVTAGNLTAGTPNHISDALINRDVGYVRAAIGNPDVSGGVVTYYVTTTDTTGLSSPVAKRLGTSVFDVPTDLSGGFTLMSSRTTNKNGYTFQSRGETISIYSETDSSSWTTTTTIDVRKLLGESLGTTNWPSGNIIIQFPSAKKVLAFTIRRNTTGSPLYTLHGSNDGSIWTQIFSENAPSSTSLMPIYLFEQNYSYYRLNATAATSGSPYNGFMLHNSTTITPTQIVYSIPGSEYSFILGLYEAYKTRIDAIAALVRQPALTQIATFNNTYRDISSCIATVVPIPATVSQANTDATSDTATVNTLTNATDVSGYTSKYATATSTLYTTMRQSQLVTVGNYKTLYDTYRRFQTDTNTAGFRSGSPTFQNLPTSQLTDATTDLSGLIALPTASPTPANIATLQSSCAAYNGTTGKYQALLDFIKLNLEIFIGRFETAYAALSQAAKTANPYTPVLSGGFLPTTTTAQDLLNYLNAYAGYAPTRLAVVGTAGGVVSAPTVSYTAQFSTAKEQADALTVILDYLALYLYFVGDTGNPSLVVAMLSADTTGLATLVSAASAASGYATNLAQAVTDRGTYVTHIGNLLSLVSANMGRIVNDYRVLYTEYNDFRTALSGYWVLPTFPAMSATAPVPLTADYSFSLPAYTAAASGIYTTNTSSLAGLDLYGSATNLGDIKTQRDAYVVAYRSLLSTFQSNLATFVGSARTTITGLSTYTVTVANTDTMADTFTKSGTTVTASSGTISNTIASWFASTFRTTYTGGRRYLLATDVTNAISGYWLTCQGYGASQPPRTDVSGASVALGNMSKALATRFEATRDAWAGTTGSGGAGSRGLTTTTTKPASLTTDKTTGSEAARLTYLGLWATLLGEIKEYTRQRVTRAKELTEWYNETGSVTVGSIGTTGMGQT